MVMTKSHSAYTDLSTRMLINMIVARGEGVIAANGALAVNTGERTDQSLHDWFIVYDGVSENTVNWSEFNWPVSAKSFDALWERVQAYLEDKELFKSEFIAGQNTQPQMRFKIITELAWHQLFCINMFKADLSSSDLTQWTIVDAANFKTVPKRDGVNSDAALMIDFSGKRILLCGMHYAGEIKKAVFTALSFLLPKQGILPMRCSANIGAKGDICLFFGASGSGKTTLVTDAKRHLIGDDAHGWGDNGIFNLERGCYPKCIDLSEQQSSTILSAIQSGSILENVVIDKKSLRPKFNDAGLTNNTRAAFPLEYIDQILVEACAVQPRTIIFLTCDVYGVLPLVAKLTPEQAVYYFLSGYSAKKSNPINGAANIVLPSFSPCYGATFYPLPPKDYAGLLFKHIKEANCSTYLVNTGWVGGPPSHGGTRVTLLTTREIINAILDKRLEAISFKTLPYFNLSMPRSILGIDNALLDPAWLCVRDGSYRHFATLLARALINNMAKMDVPAYITAAGPQLERLGIAIM